MPKLEGMIGKEMLDCIIKTLEGEMKVDKGDYIIKGVNGELYPCKEDIFHKTYQKAVDDDPEKNG